jgi:inhibitor of the pro-sigma K processing machinery
LNTTYLVIAGLIFLIIIYLVAKMMMKPVALLWKLLLNSVIGLVLLVVVNYAAVRVGFFTLPINLITILIAGFMGIPGIILLICFQMILP